MTINNLGYHFQHPSTFKINRPNGSGDYVLLILPTKSFFVLDGETVYADANSLMIYQKGTPQFYGAMDEIFINHWIHFDLNNEEEAELRAMQIPFDRPISCGDITVFAQIIKQMYIEKYSVNPRKDESLLLYLKLLWIKIEERLQATSSNRSYPYYDKMSRIRTHIYRNPTEDRTIPALAKEIALSESYFQHLYKQIFGVSVMSDVITARIEHGKYLLANTDDAVSDIALHCGYRNDVHFMRQFKATAGITPSQYRKQFRVSPTEVLSAKERQPYTIPTSKKKSSEE